MLLKMLATSLKASFSTMLAGFIIVGVIGLMIATNRNNKVESATPVNLLSGRWTSMPGVKYSSKGLSVTPVPFYIVNQDGSGGQPNPPVNIYGTYLDKATDFSLEAKFSDIKDKAILQMYGKAPIIADEFRVERQSLRLTVASGSLKADLWDGSGQDPVVSQTFPMEPGTSYDLKIDHEGGNITLSANGQTLSTISDHDIFANQVVYFGMDGTDSWLLSSLKASPIGTSQIKTGNGSYIYISRNKTALQQLAKTKRKDMLVGAAMALNPAITDKQYAQTAFDGNFGIMTTENALKWQFVHPEPNVYSFQEADALIAMAKKHGLQIHGHTLVFGEANPRWVQDLPNDQVEKVMLDHIKTVAGHYRGRIASWDVVNEPLADYDNFEAGSHELRDNKWYQAMGEDYIVKAFQQAHASDPYTKLYLNEYGLESDGERWDALLSLVKRLQDKKVPINGIGFQAHVYEASDKIDPVVLKQHMETLAQMGLKSRISEIDVYTDDGPTVQADQYAKVFEACLSEPNCTSYTTWGISDRYDYWKDDDGSIQQGQDFLWDDNMQPTLAVSKLEELLK